MKHRKSTEETFATEIIGEVKRQKRRWMIAFWIMAGITAVLSALLVGVQTNYSVHRR